MHTRSSHPSVAIDPTLVVGADQCVPLAGGGQRCYVNFDNAASTPCFRAVLDAVNAFQPWYSNVHRGSGFKSRLSSWAYDEVRRLVQNFVHADPDHQLVIFTRNTTEAINHLARICRFSQDAVVLVSSMEHHSNDLPWRRVAQVEHVALHPDGRVDEHDLRARLDALRGRVALLAVSGGSNVTGIVNPVHQFAEWAHEAGARIVVDAAQLAPHRPIDVRPPGSPGHLDFVAFSAHKMYAPFGTGVLIAPRSLFGAHEPAEVGGGTVEIVSHDRVLWTSAPEREEAGTPAIVGVIALGAALRTYGDIGWEAILAHEARLTSHALSGMRDIPGLTVYGEADPGGCDQRLGVISFNFNDRPHALVSAILSEEWGIGTRSGCFCAHPYVKALLGIDDQASRVLEWQIEQGDRSRIPGAVRVSFGLYNTMDEVVRLLEALRAIASGAHRSDYILDQAHGDYDLPGSVSDFSDYFRL